MLRGCRTTMHGARSGGGGILVRACQVDQTLHPLVASLKPSKTMALTDLATSMKESGIDVISLSVGQPDFDTPAPIAEAGVAAIQAGNTRYTPNTGTAALRAAVVNKLATDNGLQYSADEVVVSNGAKQAIWQAILACVSPGDEVIIPAPFWVSYPEMVRLAGGVPVVVPTGAADGFLMSAAQLRGALTSRTRALILCSPSNPSGAVIPRSLLEEYASILHEHPRALIIADEIYEHIIYEPADHVSFASLPGMWERTLTVNGMSKAYAMTGWRVGYLAAPLHFAKAAAVIQSQSTSGACSISQAAAVAALELGPGGGETVAEMVAEFRARRDYVVQRMAAINGLTIAEPQGAFYVLPDCSALCGDGAEAAGFGPVPDADALCQYLLEKAHVACVPGSAFGAPGCLRISYAASQAVLAEAFDRIESALSPDKLSRPL